MLGREIAGVMNHDYEAFCMAGPAFYDAPSNSGDDEIYQVGERPTPPGWQRHTTEHWIIYNPTERTLPSQGWKIHVAGCLDNAERIISAVWDYCVARDIAFKFLRSPRVVLARNAKYAGRGR